LGEVAAQLKQADLGGSGKPRDGEEEIADVCMLAEKMCAEQQEMVARSRTLTARLLEEVAASRVVPAFAADVGAERKRKRADSSSENKKNTATSAKRQRRIDLVKKLHQGARDLLKASLEVSEALIQPGMTFSESSNGEVRVYVVLAKGEGERDWLCGSQNHRSAKKITRTSTEINHAFANAVYPS